MNGAPTRTSNAQCQRSARDIQLDLSGRAMTAKVQSVAERQIAKIICWRIAAIQTIDYISEAGHSVDGARPLTVPPVSVLAILAASKQNDLVISVGEASLLATERQVLKDTDVDREV